MSDDELYNPHKKQDLDQPSIPAEAAWEKMRALLDEEMPASIPMLDKGKLQWLKYAAMFILLLGAALLFVLSRSPKTSPAQQANNKPSIKIESRDMASAPQQTKQPNTNDNPSLASKQSPLIKEAGTTVAQNTSIASNKTPDKAINGPNLSLDVQKSVIAHQKLLATNTILPTNMVHQEQNYKPQALTNQKITGLGQTATNINNDQKITGHNQPLTNIDKKVIGIGQALSNISSSPKITGFNQATKNTNNKKDAGIVIYSSHKTLYDSLKQEQLTKTKSLYTITDDGQAKAPNKKPNKWEVAVGLGINTDIEHMTASLPYPSVNMKYNMGNKLYLNMGTALILANKSIASNSNTLNQVNDLANSIKDENKQEQFTNLSMLSTPITLGYNITSSLAIEGGLQPSIVLGNDVNKEFKYYDYNAKEVKVERTVVYAMGLPNTTESSAPEATLNKLQLSSMAGLKYSLKKIGIGVFYQQAITPFIKDGTGSNITTSGKGLLSLKLSYKIK